MFYPILPAPPTVRHCTFMNADQFCIGARGGGILINPVWHKLYREICKEIFYPYFEPIRERFIEQNCLSSFVKLSQFPQLSISVFHSQQSISKKWLTHEHVSQYSIQ